MSFCRKIYFTFFHRSNLYKGVNCPLPDISTLKVQEAYHGLDAAEAPMITTMAISSDVPLVESAFGPVQEGSVLSYQLPVRKVPNTRPHTDAPDPPQLPLSHYQLEPAACAYVLTEHQHHHLASLATSFEMSHKIENSTREQSSCSEWHQLRRCRITSTKFREVCHTRAESSAENLAKRLLGPSYQTADMRRGLALENIAIEEYCKLREVNHYPCGFLIHPDAPWMGATPDGIVYDPEGQPVFGLLEIKCPNVRSYVDCPYIVIKEGTHTLRRSHPYYWQIQGQMLISGCEWCDFVVYTEDDMFIQRICSDREVFQTIKVKVGHFFFYFFLNAFLAN
uniref:YqaJ viral recombinase domain-containing protein n=1 Tax=Nothobranchius furzeri TaxID=105023 RepID=A0A8C6KPA7_NOTFU